MAPRDASAHLLSHEIGRPRMAKADLKTLEIDWIQAVGSAIRRAVSIAGLSDKEAAAKVRVDPGQFAKWLAGRERPQFDRLFAVAELREPLILQLALLLPGVEVTTQINLRKAVGA
jgi:hypothetical protein